MFAGIIFDGFDRTFFVDMLSFTNGACLRQSSINARTSTLESRMLQMWSPDQAATVTAIQLHREDCRPRPIEGPTISPTMMHRPATTAAAYLSTPVSADNKKSSLSRRTVVAGNPPRAKVLLVQAHGGSGKPSLSESPPCPGARW